MKRAGFTLIELMVVIAVIGVLAATALPQVNRLAEQSRISRLASELRTISTAMDSYFTDVGSYPPSVQDFGRAWGADVGLVDRGAVTARHQASWNGPYMKKWPVQTPWGGLVGCGAQGAYYVHTPNNWINRDGDPQGYANDYWIHMNGDCAKFQYQNGIALDKAIDNGDGGSGDVRMYWWNAQGTCCFYFYVGEGTRSW